MSRPPSTPQVPGATPAAPKPPTFTQLKAAKIFDIAKVELNLDIADKAAFDALDDDVKAKLLGYYERFQAAPADPTPAQIQAGADDVTDVAIALSKGAKPTAAEDEIDPTALDRPILTKDGWVCPAPKGSLKKGG